MWRNISRPWWAAFVATWLGVTIALRVDGHDPTKAVRIAWLAAAAVALVVWLAYKAVERRRE